MCRLFGMILNKPVDASFPLHKAPWSLLSMSRIHPKEIQNDGWGVGWFEHGKPVITKSPKAIFRDTPLVKRTAQDVKSNALIGHIRWASNPLKLPHHKLIGMDHTQPFTYGRFIFAHNGTLLIPKEVKAALGPWAKHIKGNNDSEVLFYWLMKHKVYKSTANIRRALQGLDRIWSSCRHKYPTYKYPSSGLNWVLTDGKILTAMCYVNAGGFGKAKALAHRHSPYYQLHYKAEASGVLVASEPMDRGQGWKAFHHGDILTTNGKKMSWACY